MRSGLDLINCKKLTIFINECPAIDFSKCNDCKVTKSTKENMYIKNWFSVDNTINIYGRTFHLNNDIFNSCKLFRYNDDSLSSY